jgi:hypothetical protein
MSKWNVRVNWRGKLILRRFLTWMDDGREMGEWRDATPEDLRDYFDDIKDVIK